MKKVEGVRRGIYGETLRLELRGERVERETVMWGCRDIRQREGVYRCLCELRDMQGANPIGFTSPCCPPKGQLGPSFLSDFLTFQFSCNSLLSGNIFVFINVLSL